jgi:hypothetical protein
MKATKKNFVETSDLVIEYLGSYTKMDSFQVPQ